MKHYMSEIIRGIRMRYINQLFKFNSIRLTLFLLFSLLSTSTLAASGKGHSNKHSNKHSQKHSEKHSKKHSKKQSHKGIRFAQLQDQIDALQAQIDGLDGGQNSDPIELYVDCINGDSVNAALASVEDSKNPVTVTISGTCSESVFINRDDVTLQGNSQSDGIVGTYAVAAQRGASRVSVQNMTLSGSFAGISCFSGASIVGSNLIIENGGRGVLAFSQGSCVIDDSVIRGHSQGLTILDSSSVYLRGSTVENNNVGANVWANGSLSTDGTAVNSMAIIRNNTIGVNVFSNGSFRPVDVVIEDNAVIGVQLGANSAMQIEFDNNVIVRNNAFAGIVVGSLASANLSPALTVEGNGIGISCSGFFHVNNLAAASIDTIDPNCEPSL